MASLKQRQKQIRTWSEKVGEVFYTKPRNGNIEGTVWLSRKDEEALLDNALELLGVHICIDGPTGTGKSSLSLTGLSRANFKYASVQITQYMNWQDFSDLVMNTINLNQTTLFKIGQVANEHDICKMIYEKKLSLLIDDFERANEEIVIRVADMCKLLTQSYVKSGVKLIIVGTDDIYRRLYEANHSLEGRLQEISVGTLPRKTDSWKFMLMGFDKLGLNHPAIDKKYVTKEQNIECMNIVYEVADGLPKSLNELGRDISMRGFERSRISPSDIKEEALKMPLKYINRFSREFKQIIELIQSSPAIRIVVKQLYRKGIGKIHRFEDLISLVISNEEVSFPEEQIEYAIKELVKTNFLAQTGKYGDVLFVTDPGIAHTLGVVINNPKKYGLAPEKYDVIGQLTFPFSGEIEKEHSYQTKISEQNIKIVKKSIPQLSRELRYKIAEFLASLPNIHDNNVQQILLSRAGLDPQLQHQIKVNASPEQFIELMISTLTKYGILEDGRDALEAILEATKDSIGKDRREYCDFLIQELREFKHV